MNVPIDVHPDSDEALVARIVRGEVRAFEPLYERYERRLFGFLVTRVSSRADAEELFHEAFMRTVDSGASFDHDGAFRTYLFRTARNLALNLRRSERRGLHAVESLPPESAPRTAEENLVEERMRHALHGAVERLPPQLAEVFHLRTSGLQYEEMASVLEIPLGTLKSRMNQMVNRLREELRQWTVP